MKATKYFNSTIDLGCGMVFNKSIRLVREQYIYGGMAVCAYLRNGEPWSDITVNIPGHSISDDTAFIDTNNNPWAEEFLVENGIAKPTGLTARSGYCIYPLYKFDMSKFKNLKTPKRYD